MGLPVRGGLEIRRGGQGVAVIIIEVSLGTRDIWRFSSFENNMGRMDGRT